MNRPPDAQPYTAAHEEWELRVQDWLDGSASAAEAAAVQSHLAACPSCTELVAALRSVDEQLVGSIPVEPGPSAQFEAQLFSRIATEDATRQRARSAAHDSIPREELAALRRAWRRSLMRIIGVGCLLIVALIWAVGRGALPFLSPATIAVAVANVTPLQWLATGLVGGAVATVLTRWLQAS